MDGFLAFDWDHDEKWKRYFSNIELPGADHAEKLQRVKAKWYKNNIDPNFDLTAPTEPRQEQAASGTTQRPTANATPANTTGGPATAATSHWATSAASWFGGLAARFGANRTPMSSSSSSSRGGGGGGSGSGSGNSQQQRYVLVAHATLVLLTLFHLVPVLPLHSCSLRCYWYFMRVSAVVQGYKVYLKHGKPPVWPFNWPALQMWLSQAMVSTDFFHAMTAFAFMSTRSSITLAMVPMLLVAARSLLVQGSRHVGSNLVWQQTGGRLQAWASSRERLLNKVSTWSEIALGFWLIVMLAFPSRNVLLIFFYWNMLKMRFIAPESANAHREVWSEADKMTMRYRVQLPILEQVIQYAKNWFLTMSR